jgi:hypothetical protein
MSMNALPVRARSTAAVLLILTTLAGRPGSGGAPPVDGVPPGAEPRPVNAATAVLRAFDRYPLVAVSETHGVVEQAEFLASLIRRPQFARKVNAIVLEAGNALHQGIIDRYVAGEAVSLAELRRVWRDHTCAALGPRDSPNVELFFRTVRDVNRSLPKAKRLRVLAGDPPIDWNRVRRAEDIAPWLEQRDTHYARVVVNEVLKKKRKALLIMGGVHLSRSPLPDADPRKGVMLQIVEHQYPKRTFVVKLHEGFGDRTAEIERRMARWPKPSLAQVKGTWLEPLLGPDGPDGLLYVGRRDELTMERRPVELYRDAAYVRELDRRSRIARGRPLDRAELLRPWPKKWAENFPEGDVMKPAAQPGVR